ncbi:PREDICTED: E3 ubiquitin-protein ligase XIAP-like [Branchiostoma belcheri]|uniref:E3 ubiquitin-protein ligase XIAP-like n=1 Tax=Branchiostoma belcheri TaxID=7741 RepID=A0A6P5AR52_BRABE|nr:PREDICTED: E3 ubiquitin-protein ligase XIAP-like [Branchiostoma belcheri]
MARGQNEETGSESHHGSHQQNFNNRPNERESLKGCPVGQPANDERRNMNCDDRNDLIAEHRLMNRQVDGKFDRNLSDNGKYGLGKTAKMGHSLIEAGAGPHTLHKDDYNVKHLSPTEGFNFDSSVCTASPSFHVNGHHEFATNDQVDGISSDQPPRRQDTTRFTVGSNQYQTRNLNTERDRLTTYFDWPSDVPVSPEDLAREGFFYLGYRDRVECAFCGGVLHQWEAGDDPFIEHQRHYPHCPFVNGEATANVQLGATSQQASPPTSSPSTAQNIVTSQTSQQPSTQSRTGPGTTSAYALPIDRQWPRMPDFADEDSRLSTFHNWPRYSPMAPLRLARAGFLYTCKYLLVS